LCQDPSPASAVPLLPFLQTHTPMTSESREMPSTMPKYHQVVDLQSAEIYCSQSWRPGNLRSSHQEIWCLMRAHFFINSAFSLCPHLVGEARQLSGASFTRALIPFMRAPPSRPNHLPVAQYYHLGGKDLTNEFGKT
jgi:hypothetical protein